MLIKNLSVVWRIAGVPDLAIAAAAGLMLGVVSGGIFDSPLVAVLLIAAATLVGSIGLVYAQSQGTDTSAQPAATQADQSTQAATTDSSTSAMPPRPLTVCNRRLRSPMSRWTTTKDM